MILTEADALTASSWRTMNPSETPQLSELPMRQNLFQMRSMRTGGIRSPAFKVSFGFASPLTIRPSALEDETFRKRDGLVTKSDQYMDSRLRHSSLAIAERSLYFL